MGLPYLHNVDSEYCDDIYYVDLELFDVPAMGCAYILDSDRPAIIETGIGKRHDRILDALDELEIEHEDVEVIAPTHVHLDHAGGAGFLARECPNATVMTYERGVRHLIDPSRLIAGTKQAVGDQWKFYVEPIPVPENRISSLREGDVIDLGNYELEVHHAPGHAKHQVVYFDQGSGILFSADAAGIFVPQTRQVKPTTPPSQFDLEQALTDIEMLTKLSPTTLLYTHFGPRTDVASALSEYEEILKSWVEDIRKKRKELGNDEDVINHFVHESDMTDIWGEEKARPETRMNVQGVLGYLDRK